VNTITLHMNWLIITASIIKTAAMENVSFVLYIAVTYGKLKRYIAWLLFEVLS